LNLASLGALHASEMYARNVFNFVQLLLKDGALAFDWNDELLAKTVWPRAPVVPSAAVAPTAA
jgi:NAD(P) transhydrogenase subunit alpha